MEELTDYELGYIAGIIDGEGSLGMQKLKRGYVYYYYICCQICNTDKSVIEYLRYICGSYTAVSKRVEHNRKPCYIVRFSKHILEELLLSIDLIVKRKHQELLLEAISIMKGKCHKYSDSERNRLEEIYQEIKKLNKRGR